MENVLTLLVIAPLAYLAGSVNFSIVLFRLLGRDDPRTRFSTNPGVTNVYRQAGRLWALLVLLLDLGRASALACISLRLLPPAFLPWCALFLLLGNMYPLFHGFKGGKGVANYLGFTLVPAPWFAAAKARGYGSASSHLCDPSSSVARSSSSGKRHRQLRIVRFSW